MAVNSAFGSNGTDVIRIQRGRFLVGCDRKR
jgi:hypothetical protein